MDTGIGIFNGTDWVTSVLPSIGSLKNERYQVSVLLNAPVAGSQNDCVSILVTVKIADN